MVSKGWFIPYIKENQKLFALVLFLGAIAVFSASMLMYTSGFLISKAATRPENILMVYVPIVAVRTFGISRSAARYAERLASHQLILTMIEKMRVRLYDMAERSAKQTKLGTGEMLGLLSEDVERLQDAYLKTIFPSIGALLLYAASIGALGLFSWPFAGLMLLYMALLVFVFPYITVLVNRARQIQMKKGRNELYSHLTDAVMGVSDWLFSGRQNDFVEGYERKEAKLLALEAAKHRFIRLRQFLAQLVIGGAVVFVVYWSGSVVQAGSMPHTLIAAFVLVLFPLTEAFLPLSDAAGDIPVYQHAVSRLNHYEKQSYEGLVEREAADETPVSDGVEAVCFDQVTFGYEVNQHVLKHFSFSLKQGESLALLGKSGAGKSTILKLLEGAVVPNQGVVSIQGKPVQSIQEEISSYVSVLNQQPYLFDTSVLNNIRLGSPEATEEQVKEAARQVQLHDYIESLPEGYHTGVQETGVRFSGGERQRMALARILLQNTPIVVLDEPTVGLDPRTERELLETIFRVLKGKTVIWITHHLTGCEACDRMMFIEDGRIEMQGQHHDLLKENVRYQKLYEMDRPFSVV
ncbi:thiol reductant ABC exporter subunit CydC [Bacillus altitudinis MN12]|uniref:ATP-binding cassette subfamily C protein CydC n=1 Tax=Bacillus aerius TaxID=293388 RepID=A0ABR6AXB4_9BACI|nr:MULTISPECIES: thiol reductant ABC exporter subunit CydC [Bacillus]MCA1014782.1 thiol reductant ABC exporter subunit CydC [Bacillus stratosphericus]ATP95838.1 thiol reductant ABC exporter subunit CydC [Bacillus altitudinis]MBA8916517.1 ATP-binding cassette subfamily C protein CydC [Bacillus aerius]MBR0584230.1 thiol reductant ABC exporter subunit CydC [Bacillus altitudinis MN12]MBR0594973.1 thiol reductant ABC exporter subunit CydC [Bacillus altitudinis C16B11]